MATTSTQGGSFNILGSSKLNTVDGKNPTNKPASTSTGEQAKGKDEGSARTEADRVTACQKAHDALEARLRDEELNARSRGWS